VWWPPPDRAYDPELAVAVAGRLSAQLDATPRGSADRPKLLAQLAKVSFYIEAVVYKDCREQLRQGVISPQGARSVVRIIAAARSAGDKDCTLLRREQHDTASPHCP
jgi:hypothetical protein